MTPAQLRLAYNDESSLHRITSSAPPVTQNYSERTTKSGRTLYEWDLEGEPPDRIGQNLSAEMVSLIGGIKRDWVSYGPRHPIRRAMAEFDRQCRRKHQSWYDHETGVCGQMVRDVIEGGASVRWCADRYAMSWPKAERLIVAGLNYIGERYERWEQDSWRLTTGVESLQLNPTP